MTSQERLWLFVACAVISAFSDNTTEHDKAGEAVVEDYMVSGRNSIKGVLVRFLEWALDFPLNPSEHYDAQEKLYNYIFWQTSLPVPVFDMMEFPWAAPLREHADVILEEWHAFERRIQLANMTQVWKLAAPHWKNIFLYHGGWYDRSVTAHFPRTMGLLAQTPLYAVMFSVLPAGREIAPHRGEYKGMLRYHLGLQVPQPEPSQAWQRPKEVWARDALHPSCPPERLEQTDRGGRVCLQPASHLAVLNYHEGSPAMSGRVPKVKDISHVSVLTWGNGTDFVFDDSYYHYAQHRPGNDRGDRVILFCDFPRHDLPLVLHWFNLFVVYYVAPFLPFVTAYMYNQAYNFEQQGFASELQIWVAQPQHLVTHALLLCLVLLSCCLCGKNCCWCWCCCCWRGKRTCTTGKDVGHGKKQD